MSFRVRAPATIANLGPGFDCAAVALDYWNEVEVTEGGRPDDPEHLAVRAFALVTSPDGYGFDFTDPIPRGSGMGSSAATIALGLVAGCVAAGCDPEPEELLALGLPLEGHPDNLAAALEGGVVLTWDGRIERIADDVPAVPIAVCPAGEVSTRAARAALPAQVTHADAVYTVSRAALLGAALATASPTLFAAALDDRLHEPYRAANAPLLETIRRELPPGALGATLSGSGPTVIVWAEPQHEVAVVDALTAYDAGVCPFRVSASGAGPC